MSPPLAREQFLVADRFRYLNHARLAAPPTMVAHALARDASAATMLGSTASARREERTEIVRATAASLLGAAPDDVTLVRNTIDGLALVLDGFPWAAGDKVVVADHEYSLTHGTAAALSSRGVEILVAPTDDGWCLPAENLEQALAEAGPNVRAVVVSWVGYARGGRNDLAELARIAHRHEAILVVDLVQGAGVLPCDLRSWDVDAAACGAQKWLLGPEGVGLLVTTPELRRRLRVRGPGLNLVVSDGDRFRLDLDADPSGRRFDGSTMNVGGIGGLGASIDLLTGAGMTSVWAHVDTWCDHLVDGLTDLGAVIVSDRSADRRSSIVTARFEQHDAELVADRLVAHGVIVTAWHGAVRFAPHGWNDDDDLAATLHALRRVLRH